MRLSWVAQELRVQGHRDAARELFDESVVWYRSRPLDSEVSRAWLALFLYWAEQWDEVSLGPCGMLELGAIRGEGRSSTRIADAFTAYRLWLAVDVVGRLEVAAGPSLGLHLQAGLALPLLRPGFLYRDPDVLVFRPPRVGVIAVAGMSWGAP